MKKTSGPSVQKRLASHAGSWYSNQMSVLSSELGNYLNTAKFDVSIPKNVFGKALVSPHAGFTYSGPTAAYGYRVMRDTINRNPIKRIFVLGPSHHFHMNGCAISPATLIETPLGHIPVDEQTVEDLQRTKLFKNISIDQDEEEHSLEMQFPYLKYIYGSKNIPVVNIMVGDLTSSYLSSVTKVLKPYFMDKESLFVFSTDFCHWGSRFGYQEDYRQSTQEQLWEGIKRLDIEGVKHIENKDLKGFQAYLNQTCNTICGRNPLKILLSLLGENSIKNLYHSKMLKYDQSEHARTKYDSSVSYVSMLVYNK
jgi:AmmeMemoRadiSam system protein B